MSFNCMFALLIHPKHCASQIVRTPWTRKLFDWIFMLNGFIVFFDRLDINLNVNALPRHRLFTAQWGVSSRRISAGGELSKSHSSRNRISIHHRSCEMEKEISKRDQKNKRSFHWVLRRGEENYKLFTTSTYFHSIPMMWGKKKTRHRWRRRKAWNIKGKNSISWPWTFIFLSASSSFPRSDYVVHVLLGMRTRGERRRKK